MQSVTNQFRLHFEIETQECKISDDARNQMQPYSELIANAVAEFPNPQLWITIVYHTNSDRYHAQAKLKLPGETIITGAYDEQLQVAFERCAMRVIRRVNSYKAEPDRDAIEQAKREATRSDDVIAPVEPDSGRLGEAIQNDDYVAFRRAFWSHEEWVRKRVGRWVQRYQEVQEQIGQSLEIADLVEEVFLLAFERYAKRSKAVSISEWLDSLVDPAVKTFCRHPGEEKDAVRRAESASRVIP
jgi:ribosome-associated translation inhibitor RaiA